jgi:hypothetical protein
MSHGKSGQQKQNELTSVQDQQREQAALKQQGTDLASQSQSVGSQNNALNQAQGNLNQFSGPVQNSPFYKSLLRQGIQSTSNAYDAAKASMSARANAAGFGYNQPINQAGQAQVDTSEAQALGAIPDQAMIAAAPLSMQATGLEEGIGSQYGQQANMFGNQALGFGQQALGFGGQQLAANNLAYNQNRQRGPGGFWGALSDVQQIGQPIFSGLEAYYGGGGGSN